MGLRHPVVETRKNLPVDPQPLWCRNFSSRLLFLFLNASKRCFAVVVGGGGAHSDNIEEACVLVCCTLLQCVALCCNVLQCDIGGI